MRLFELAESDLPFARQHSSAYVHVDRSWGLPGVECDACQSTWATTGSVLPTVDLSVLGDVEREFREVRSEPLAEYRRLRALIAPLVADPGVLEPGTEFGPLVGKVRGWVGDLAWKLGTVLMRAAKLQALRDKGVRGFVGAPSGIIVPRDNDGFVELEILPRVHLARAHEALQASCDVCGLESYVRPERIAVVEGSVPVDVDVFRCVEVPTAIFVTERAASAIERLALTDVALREVGVE